MNVVGGIVVVHAIIILLSRHHHHQTPTPSSSKLLIPLLSSKKPLLGDDQAPRPNGFGWWFFDRKRKRKRGLFLRGFFGRVSFGLVGCVCFWRDGDAGEVKWKEMEGAGKVWKGLGERWEIEKASASSKKIIVIAPNLINQCLLYPRPHLSRSISRQGTSSNKVKDHISNRTDKQVFLRPKNTSWAWEEKEIRP